MKTPETDITAITQTLCDELRREYPYIHTENSVVEDYVTQCYKSGRTPSVHLLYDYVLSQNLCEVDE